MGQKTTIKKAESRGGEVDKSENKREQRRETEDAHAVSGENVSAKGKGLRSKKTKATRSLNSFDQKIHLRSLNERNKMATQSSEVYVWLDFTEGGE